MSPPLHLAFAGKGGAGKSVVAATAARLLARQGRQVLVLDSDLLPGLTWSLGVIAPARPPLEDAVEPTPDGRWRLRPGIDAAAAVERFAIEGPDGVRVLQAGKSGGPEGPGRVRAAAGLSDVAHGVRGSAALESWDVIGDLPGGPRQPAFGWAPYADRVILVVEPTTQSVLTARRVARITRARGGAEVALVVNKAADGADVARVEREIGLRALTAVPADEAVRRAERAGAALLDEAPESPAVRAIERLVERLTARSLVA